ncbi:MAG: triose-phosphate isomerase [Thermoplasmata archaeon]|nr:triose-phosphate isomerase [Thermoplasmata archaeon]
MSTDAAPLGAPILVLNRKAYPNAVGAGAERIGRLLERLGAAAGVAVALCPSAPDLGLLARHLELPILAQHTDPDAAGARTGAIVAEFVAAAGARGSLVNHSERSLEFTQVAAIVARLSALDLVPVVCAPTVAAARRLAVLKPSYLAVEPPELIGGDRSVSSARPEVIERAVAAVHGVAPGTHVLCGAGVHDREDVRRALELGSEGILVASAVTKASSPGDALRELLKGYSRR